MNKMYLLLIFLLSFSKAIAQEHDYYFADLINRNDIFSIKKHEKLISNIQGVELKNIANSLVNYYFNKPQESNYYIKKLFHESTNLDNGTAVNMLLIMGANYRRMGCYDSAYHVLESLINVPKFSSSNDIKITSGLKNMPKMDISFDTSSVKIKKDVESGLYMIKIYDLKKTAHEFILDTGAPYSTILESDCPNFGIKIIADSLIMNGIYVKLGIAPSIEIDKTKISNAVFFIIPDSIGIQQHINLKTKIIGFDILSKADNIEISKTSMTFNKPKYQEKILNNMAFDGNSIIVNLNLGIDDISFMYDSGLNSSFLCPIIKNKLISYENEAKEDSINMIGVKGLTKIKIINYHNIPLNIEESIKIIPNLMMRISDSCTYGLLGQDITELYSKIILDFRNMTFILK